MLEIRRASAVAGRTLRLTLTDGSIVERDITDLLWGPVFERLAVDDELFRRVRVRYGTVTWPGNVDIAPETMIWGDTLPADENAQRPPPFLRVQSPSRRERSEAAEWEAAADDPEFRADMDAVAHDLDELPT